MSWKSNVCLPLAGACLLWGCGAGSASGSSRIAEFNGQPVTRDQYLKRLETLQFVRVRLPNGEVVAAQVADPLSNQALQLLLQEEALLQAARDEKVLPTKDDVEKEKTLRDQLRSGYVTELKKLGLSIEDIDRLILIELARERLATRGVTPKTLEDVDKYVKENPAVTRVPPTVTMRWIVVETAEDQKKVDDDLKAGLQFGSVASKYSKAPNATMNNGAFPDQAAQPTAVEIERLDSGLQDLVKKTPEGRISDWYVKGNQRIKIFVEAKSPEGTRELTTAQKEVIRRDLMMREGGLQNDVSKLVVEKLLAAKVKVTPDYLRNYWETYAKQLKEAAAGVFGSPEPQAPATPSGGQQGPSGAQGGAGQPGSSAPQGAKPSTGG